jgi:hypothetical protein
MRSGWRHIRRGGKIAASFSMGLYYLWLELVRHYTESATWAWLGFVALFSVFVVPSQPRPAARLLVLIVGLVAAVLAGLYTAYVIAYFATAEDLATRGRNEVVVFLLAGGGCVVALAARFLPSLGHHAHIRMTALVACGLLSFLLLDSVALGYVRAEESQFATFWSESCPEASISSDDQGPGCCRPQEIGQAVHADGR